MKKLVLLCAALCLAGAVFANDAQPLAEDPVVEQRLLEISEELRCLVCQNESLAGSRADLANDLRREIRSLIRAGKSDAEIREYLVSRYGDFVLYRPPLKASTLLLWGGPFVLLVAGIAGLLLHLRRRNASADSPLDATARARIDALLADADAREKQQ